MADRLSTDVPTSYPVQLHPGSPLMANLIDIRLRRRDPRYPPLYEFHGQFHGHHPLISNVEDGGRIVVYMFDPSAHGRALSVVQSHFCESLSEIGILISANALSATRGLLRLRPGDVVLARPIDKGGEPLHDIIMVVVPPNAGVYYPISGAALSCLTDL